MSVFLLLVLVQISSESYQTKMAPFPSMEACLVQAAILQKSIPPQEGVSYSLTCIQVKATTEVPA